MQGLVRLWKLELGLIFGNLKTPDCSLVFGKLVLTVFVKKAVLGLEVAGFLDRVEIRFTV